MGLGDKLQLQKKIIPGILIIKQASAYAMGRASGFLRILRPVNSVMLGVGVLVGVVITGGLRSSIPLEILTLAFITGFTLAGSAMVINDYFDREIDAVNEPSRPIPSGEVKPKEAVAYSLLLSGVGLVAAFLTSLPNLAIAVFSWFVMMVYSAWGKRTGFLGNLMVSTCIGLPFIYGGVIAGNVSTSLLFSALAFLSNTGREITKGIVDTEGDASRGVKTIAVAYGVDKAAYFASSFLPRRSRCVHPPVNARARLKSGTYRSSLSPTRASSTAQSPYYATIAANRAEKSRTRSFTGCSSGSSPSRRGP